MAYKVPYYNTSRLQRAKTSEGQTIEQKIEQIVHNGEPISDGAPLTYTERKDGVQAAYNIRTDRWEIAAEAMDAVHKSNIAKRDSKGKTEEKEAKVIDMKDSKAESTNGTTDSK